MWGVLYALEHVGLLTANFVSGTIAVCLAVLLAGMYAYQLKLFLIIVFPSVAVGIVVGLIWAAIGWIVDFLKPESSMFEAIQSRHQFPIISACFLIALVFGLLVWGVAEATKHRR